MDKELWLFTMKFPYGLGESYLETELPIVAEAYDRVRIFPLEANGPARPLPAHAEVHHLLPGPLMYTPLPPLRVLAILPRFLRAWHAVVRTAPSRNLAAKRRRELLSILRQTFNRQRLLAKAWGKQYHPGRVTLYSYWTSDWASVLACWKLADRDVRFVSRMHGFDLYAERAEDGWPMLQAFQVEQAERILVASQAGLDDVLSRYPAMAHKFKLARLATLDHGAGPWAPSATLRVVSCSNLVELKRVPLIAEALGHVQGPVQWTHFGDGPERGAVEAAVKGLPGNISVELMGNRPNSEVIGWYRSRPADVFVHASSTEGGAPVAMQEAASFGIPLVAADAGGVREVVTAQSGILLPHAVLPQELGRVLNGFRQSPWYATGARAQVRAFWESRFNARTVYGTLARELAAGPSTLRPRP